MQRGLLAVLVTIVVAGIAAVASYVAGYQAGLVAPGTTAVAPIVYGWGGFGFPWFFGFFGFLLFLILIFALFRAVARPRWGGPEAGWGYGRGWDRGHWASGEHPIPPGLEELHRRLHEERPTTEGPRAAG
jgi:hypothetical protein